MKAIVSSTILLTVLCGMTERAMAQVVPDNTVGTTVNQAGAVFNINNGIRSGNNLFHSFSQFSVPTGGSAIFNNALDIQNIFSRVTGSQLSNIDGILKTQGSANLFLMNPNGIVFGPNAQLQLGGSFLGTTASAIKFADGIEFNTVNSTPALLSINLPIGLQMGQTPGAITVNNTGHQLVASRSAPPSRGLTPPGLSVANGNTLAFIGSEVNLNGGVLTAPSGHLELGSASNGIVSLNTSSQKWSFSYTHVPQFGDIRLSQQSLADVTGAPAGSIHLQGQNISLSQGSVAFSNNQGNQASGNIIINASESFEMQGVGSSGFVRNVLQANNLGAGPGGNLIISAPRILLQDGSAINTQNFGSGIGGNISIDASTSIQAIGFSSINPSYNSSISAVTTGLGGGSGGNLHVTTGQLRIQDGASVFMSSSGTGNAGKGTIDVSKLIEVIGESLLSPSGLAAPTINRGNAGQLIINTSTLRILEGGSVATTTLGMGNAGSLQVNADEITVSGKGRLSGTPSRLGARAEILSPAFQKAFKLSPFPTGNSGNLLINTSQLTVTDGAIVGVDHEGVGKAGDLYLRANTVLLDRQGSITASTKAGGATFGPGANLSLIIRDALILRHGSSITSKAGGLGNGGNITIDSPVIVGLENSDIIANAAKGNGGNIKITTQGLFGLKYRDRLTPNNDITASSEFGINGNVQVNTIGINPANGLTTLPSEVVDSSRLIADRCGAARTSSFVATGRGGIPQGPKKRGSDRTWHDLRSLTATNQPVIQPVAVANPAEPISEASAIQIDASGTISLVASKPLAKPLGTRIGLPSAATCGRGEGAIDKP